MSEKRYGGPEADAYRASREGEFKKLSDGETPMEAVARSMGWTVDQLLQFSLGAGNANAMIVEYIRRRLAIAIHMIAAEIERGDWRKK